MMHSTPVRAGAAGLMLWLAGCAVGPVYQPPTPSELGVPASWRGKSPDEKVIPDDLSQWWRKLGDDRLTALVGEALQHNPDLDSARAALRASRARQGVAEAGRLPSVTASASAASSQTGNNAARDQYQAGFDASWEPDVFGGQRAAVTAAAADADGSAAGLAQAQVSLAAEVARNYVQLRSLQARLEITRRNLASQEETRALTGWRAQAGLTSELAVEQAVAALEQTRAQIPALESSLAAAENRLAILTGQAPGALHDRLTAAAPLPSLPAGLVIGIPADTLRQRPDVQAAERRLAAETARSGVAAANRYPSFRLSGSVGLEALTLTGLGDSNALNRSLLAGITAPLFDGGRLKQQAVIQSAVQDQALAAYRSTVLTALEDVENALANLSAQQQRLVALTAGAKAAVNAAELARQRYQAGITDYQTVLDTERSRLSLEDSRQSTEADLVLALVQLYKALGGGWSAPASIPTSASGNPS
ncbi:MAG TPA: efflux transporter outer membrane subunit [Fluviicoccus sp.]|nr:efflux transporter outer membrane subunit [Fluviicoccus sp.]